MWEITMQDGRKHAVKKAGPGAQVDFERHYDQPAHVLNVPGCRFEWRAYVLWAQLTRSGKVTDDFDMFLGQLDDVSYVDGDDTTVKHLHRLAVEKNLIGKATPYQAIIDLVAAAEAAAEKDAADEFARLAREFEGEAGELGKDLEPASLSPESQSA